jgi:hypothetical protein
MGSERATLATNRRAKIRRIRRRIGRWRGFMAGRGYNTGAGEKFFGVVVKKDVLQGLKPLIFVGVFGEAEAPAPPV